MVHTWGAILLHTPELNITEKELSTLNESYAEFSKYHDIPMDPKRLSELNLIGSITMVYGTRIWAIMRRHKMQTRSRVVPFPQSAQPSSGSMN